LGNFDKIGIKGDDKMNATSRQKEIEAIIKECKEDAERTNQPLERR